MYRSLNIKSLASSLTVLALSVSLLTACGGDDKKVESSATDTPATDTPATDTLQTGVFLDSPVINIGYGTETQSGFTNSLGEYKYLAGETVTFFIGDLEFPSVAATGTVTPLDLAGTQDTSDPTVVNMIRLLQTLDKDGNLDNGIEITDTAKSTATAVDFSSSETEFENSSAVTNLTMNAGLDAPINLVSKADAIAHFEGELAEMSGGESSANFSESALRNTTLYNVYFDVSGWVTETISFGGQNNMTLDGEGGTFAVTNGVLILNFGGGDVENIKILSFDETLNARVTCWENTITSQFDCAGNELEYMFSSPTEAQAYRDARNEVNDEPPMNDETPVNDESPVNFSDSALRNTTIYNVYFDVSGWVTESLSFDDQNNVVFDGDGDSGTFSVINGILVLNIGGDVDNIKIISFDETLNARVTCWEGAITSPFNCAGNELEYMFTSLAEAQAFRDTKNSSL